MRANRSAVRSCSSCATSTRAVDRGGHRLLSCRHVAPKVLERAHPTLLALGAQTTAPRPPHSAVHFTNPQPPPQSFAPSDPQKARSDLLKTGCAPRCPQPVPVIRLTDARRHT